MSTPAACAMATALLAMVTASPGASATEYTIHEAIYPSLDVAVKSLSKCFHDRSRAEDAEYTAAIISDGVRVHVTVEASEPGLDVGWLTIRLRRGESLVALWHTHGSRGFGREQFSSGDVALARRLAIPIFLTNPKGHLARYDPPSQDNGRRSEPTPGKRIGHVRGKDFVCGLS